MSYTKKKSKIKYIFFLISSVLVVSLFVIMKVRGNADGYRTISIVEVSGNVSVVKNGIEYVAYEGIRLGEGHEIVTAGNSYVRLILDGDKYVKLEAGSKDVTIAGRVVSISNPRSFKTRKGHKRIFNFLLSEFFHSFEEFFFRNLIFNLIVSFLNIFSHHM